MKRTPLKRKTPMKRTGSLAPVSKKRAKTNRQRSKFVKEELDNRRWCEAHIPEVCTRYSTEIHEPILRSAGGSILDKANSVAICRMCHRWVHDNVAEAKKIGLIKQAPPYTRGVA
tara:strand:+ start:2549 stop:2893 length:345 start_codon:yes stop_codon:yes gene_type:complete